MDKKKKKVKKRKISFKKIFKLFIILFVLYFILRFILNIKITNIYITNNSFISDKEIINIANLDNYPSYFLTSKKKIKSNILKNNSFIKDVQVTKKMFKVYINIKEYKIIAIDKLTNKLLLENKEKVDNIYNIFDMPILVNDVFKLYDNFIEKFSLIDSDILLKISEIEYLPVEVDKERFLLRMNDGNYVYITLSKIKNLNKYNEIYDELNGKKGIIYLDSGNYIEIKE